MVDSQGSTIPYLPTVDDLALAEVMRDVAAGCVDTFGSPGPALYAELDFSPASIKELDKLLSELYKALP